MKLSFQGAAHEVTGSCHYLQACGKKILIDCGMQQGADEYEHQELPVAPGEVDYILLTHAHIDHSGRIPLLVKCGFKGEICATGATCDLCDIMLRDSAHIQEFEAEWKNRKGQRAGRDIEEPLYTMKDAEAAVSLLRPFPYGKEFSLCEGISIRFVDVGHLLGSASIEVWATENGETKKIVFSGDIGNLDQPLINDPVYIQDADYVVMEATYGDRLHEAPPDYCAALADIIRRTLSRGGNVVIPSFAVGRTQELLYFIREIKTKGLAGEYGNFPVYVDSPLAIEATHIFKENENTCYDFEAMALVRKGINPLSFPNLHLSVTSDDSRAINFDDTPKVIISASGMCEAGRIKHHLKHNLWRPESTVIFVGYQAAGTLGRLLAEGAPVIKIFGETIDVNAEVLKLDGISGHADQAGLLRWLDAFETKPKHVFVVHGQEAICDSFAALVTEKFGITATAPNFGQEHDLLRDVKLQDGIPRPEKTARISGVVSGVFGRLVAAGKRLMVVIEHNKGGANKDLARFADQITSLCDKWDR